ncbi:hypothetical protein NRK67_02505 [Fusobacteria bacterium ZRK30]|nr:hypothetical protein NRK67_02505 [Fusobacteria bacterium ZRK30]
MGAIVTSDKIEGIIYEIGLLTKEDSRNYNIKFLTNQILTDLDIKTKLETITGCYVESIKRVTKYKRIKTQSNTVPKGIKITGRYILNGLQVRTDSLFFPLVLKAYQEPQQLENQLKEFFGNDFQVVAYTQY